MHPTEKLFRSARWAFLTRAGQAGKQYPGTWWVNRPVLVKQPELSGGMSGAMEMFARIGTRNFERPFICKIGAA